MNIQPDVAIMLNECIFAHKWLIYVKKSLIFKKFGYVIIKKQQDVDIEYLYKFWQSGN